MSDRQHTPGPWKVISKYVSPVQGVGAAIEDTKENRVVAELFGTDEFVPEAKSNAAFIVKAVNAHDALLEALEYWLEYVESSSLDSVAGLKGWQGKARAAIKRVEEATT